MGTSFTASQAETAGRIVEDTPELTVVTVTWTPMRATLAQVIPMGNLSGLLRWFLAPVSRQVVHEQGYFDAGA